MLQKKLGTDSGMSAAVCVKQIHDWVEREANQMLRDMDLTLMQGRTMLWLWEKGGEATQREIQSFLSVSHPTAVGIVRRLEAKGLILCRPAGREKQVRLAEAEDGFYRRVERAQAELEERMLRSLGDAERAALKGMLRDVCASLEREDERALTKDTAPDGKAPDGRR